MYDFIYNLWFIYNEIYMMGMGENPRNIYKRKPRVKFPLMKEENYLWHIGRFHHAHMGQSILWVMIGWIISLDMLSVSLVPKLDLW